MTRLILVALLALGMLAKQPASAQSSPYILSTDELKDYVQYFNSLDDPEDVKNFVPNDAAFTWLSKNIPLLSCPDSILQQTYYYRWWTFRKHLKKTGDGYVFTEFITPVSHATTHNAIACALGHHIYEGRWLHNPTYIDQYVDFWLYTEQNQSRSRFHSFSSWLIDAEYNRFLITRDTARIQQILPLLIADYNRWEGERLRGPLFWQFDVKDGMEESISGGRRVRNWRPTINSYMYGNALALVHMGAMVGADSLIAIYQDKAERIKQATQQLLWHPRHQFFEVGMEKGDTLSAVREAIGFILWYMDLPDDNDTYARAWNQLIDTAGFNAPWGLTTAERRHPQFRSHGTGTCEWDGAIWPFASTQTLKALSHLLTDYQHHGKMTRTIFFDALKQYARAHQKNGKPYIGEYQDEITGYWLKGDSERSRFYNHSGFCDLVINDLIGLKPQADNTLKLVPLVPPNTWSWFCLDNVMYHDHLVTILWDKNGRKYHQGKGLRVFVDGQLAYRAKKLQPATILL